MNRALRAATMGALLLSPVAITACSAGQVAQTATQNRDKVGPEATVGDITLRQITLAYPQDGLYAQGDEAELRMAIINGDTEDDTLVGIEGEAFDGVVVSGQATPVPAVPGSPSAAAETVPAVPTPTETVPAVPTPAETVPPATGPEAATTPGATPTVPSPTTVPTTPPAPSASTQVQIPVPAGSAVFLGGSSGATVELADLSEELTAGETIQVTLTFERAGEVTVPVLVATPERSLPRGAAFDFHKQEGHGEAPAGEGHGGAPAEGAEDIAREGESGAGSGPGGHD